jgi:hypothetical protein
MPVIHGKTLAQWRQQLPEIDQVIAASPLLWVNPRYRGIESIRVCRQTHAGNDQRRLHDPGRDVVQTACLYNSDREYLLLIKVSMMTRNLCIKIWH